MPRYPVLEQANVDEAFDRLTVPALKPLARLISDNPPTRKAELVEALARTMRDEQKVRALYERLGKPGQAAVREAVHSGLGELDVGLYQAKYCQRPDYGTDSAPTLLRLFFPSFGRLPRDLQGLLRKFAPAPDPVDVATVDELPETVEPVGGRRPPYSRGDAQDEQETLVVQATEQAALHDVHAVLRLIEAGKVGVSATTRRPSQAAVRAVAGALHSGDFYGEENAADYDGERLDLQIKGFAWPLIVQAAGFASISGSKLQLTPAGRKAAAQPPQEAIRTAWRKWLGTTLLDELSRVNAIKGQGGKGKSQLTAIATRRETVAEALAECPDGSWIAIDEFFRFMRASGFDFQVTRNPWSLYISDPNYGSLGYDGYHDWEILQGRYAMAFLFEYGATMGIVDVAYTSPVEARRDFAELWGTDDLPFLSRYDGLRYVRITRLGTWCLDQSERYEPEPVVAEPLLKVLPNLDVVVTGRQLAPGDALFLERFAEQTGDAVWRLSSAKCLSALENGLSLDDLREFLSTRSGAPLPQTVVVFLADLRERAGRLRDLGASRLIECQDPELAQLLANDRRLRDLCLIAGDRYLVFRAADESTVRRALRELGYPLPAAK